MKISFYRSSGFIIEKNVLHAGGPIMICDPRVTALAAMPNNIFFNGNGIVETHILENYDVVARAVFALRDGTVIADPLLRHLDRRDFTFAPDSPASKLGINTL